MKKFLATLPLIVLLGCSDPRLDEAKALVNRWADQLDTQTEATGIYVRRQGPLDNDPWGSPLTVTYSQGGLAETLVVRSVGPDGVSHSKDDLVATRISMNVKGVGTGIKKNAEETAENAGRGFARGVIQGAKEELQKKAKD